MLHFAKPTTMSKRQQHRAKPLQDGVVLFGHHLPNELLYNILQHINVLCLIPWRRVSKKFENLLHQHLKHTKHINLINTSHAVHQHKLKILSRWVPNVEQIWIAFPKYDLKVFFKHLQVLHVVCSENCQLKTFPYIRAVRPPPLNDTMERLKFWLGLFY